MSPTPEEISPDLLDALGVLCDQYGARGVLLAVEATHPGANPHADLCMTAWGIIANAYGGDWSQASDEWRAAAERWRDAWHATLPETWEPEAPVLEAAASVPPPAKDARPFSDMSAEGLLWLINRSVFHPRGFALAFHKEDDGTVSGWSMLGDGSEVWTFSNDADDEEFAKVAAFFARLVPSSKEPTE